MSRLSSLKLAYFTLLPAAATILVQFTHSHHLSAIEELTRRPYGQIVYQPLFSGAAELTREMVFAHGLFAFAYSQAIILISGFFLFHRRRVFQFLGATLLVILTTTFPPMLALAVE